MDTEASNRTTMITSQQESGSWRDVVLENALDAVIGVNELDEVIDWNRQAEVIFGWNRVEAIGQKMSSLIFSDEYRKLHVEGLRDYLATGTSRILNRRIEVEARRKSGEKFLIELTVIPASSNGSTIFYSFLRDISEAKRNEAERTAARRRLELQYSISSALSAAPSVSLAMERVLAEICRSLGWNLGLYWTADSTGHLNLLSTHARQSEPEFEKFLNVSRTIEYRAGGGIVGEIWSRGLPEWRPIHPETRPELPRARAAQSAKLRSAFWFPIRRSAMGSEPVQTIGLLEFIGREQIDRDGEIIKSFAALSQQIVQFIDRVEAKEAVDKAAREFQAVNRVKDEFLASLSHELRTPLTAILGFAEVLRDESDFLSKSERLDCIQGILRNATAQTEMISDLLDVSRIITGKVAFKPVDVAIVTLAEQITENFRATATAKNVQLSLETKNAPETIYADPVRIQQILWNLISNALKFTSAGGRVTLRIFTEDDHCSIEVQDTGVGIEPEFLPYVFERFRQEDSSMTRSYGGLGLGLAIARHLAEIHGGSLKAASEGKGKGSLFRLRVPLPSQPSLFVLSPAATQPSAKLDIDLKGKSIVLVEDSVDSRHLVRRLLARAGAEVREASSAQEARDLLAKGIPDLIISDIGMPNESGLEFMTALRANTENPASRVPAIALTAYVRSEEKDDILNAGFQAHVAKPVSKPALMAAIVSILKKVSVVSGQ